MAIPPDILRANATFIQSLSEDDHTLVKVRADGRMAPIGGRISQIFDAIIPKAFPVEHVMRSSVQLILKENAPSDHPAFRIFLTATLAKLQAHGVLTPALKKQILTDHQDRIVEGYKMQLAALRRDTSESPGESRAVEGSGASLTAYISSGAGAAATGDALRSPRSYATESSLLEARAHIAVAISSDPLLTEEFRRNYGVIPTAYGAGASESFFVKGLDGIVGVFKPKEGEIGMSRNARKVISDRDAGHSNFVQGVEIGTMYKREVAASKFCFGHLGYVPETCLISLPCSFSGEIAVSHEGSIQAFVADAFTYDAYIDEMDGHFMDKGSSKMTHGLVIRDLLIGSSDRHVGNMLFKDGIIYGIDNGMSFPEGLIRKRDPISKTVSHLALYTQCQSALDEEVIEELNSLDIDREIRMLQRDGLIAEKQAIELKMRHALLIKLISVKPPLNVFQIAFCFMQDPERKPVIVDLIQQTWAALPGMHASAGDMSKGDFERFSPVYIQKIDAYFTEEFIEGLRNERP